MFKGPHSKATKAKMKAKALERWADPEFREPTVASLRKAHQKPSARKNHSRVMLDWWERKKALSTISALPKR